MSDEYELVHRYRPKLFKDVVGQESACATLGLMLKKNKLPHALLFTGPSGTGKTTLARIVAAKLNVDPWNLKEINAAEARGIDAARDVITASHTSSLVPGNRVWIIDEAHKLTGDAQNSLLKPLEEPRRDVYFMLATTDPTKVIATIRTRCTEIKCGLAPGTKIEELVKRVAAAERDPISDEIAGRIAEVADGCCRKALTVLQSVLAHKDEVDRVEAVQKSEYRRAGIDLCRALLPFKGPPSWAEVAKILAVIDEEAEGVRRLVMGYFASVMVKSPKAAARCATVMNYFRDPFYDSAGKAMLVLACYEACEALK